jgi:hypothetical protein
MRTDFNRGFSMGGAGPGTAAHHASLWAAASPGATVDTFIFRGNGQSSRLTSSGSGDFMMSPITRQPVQLSVVYMVRLMASEKPLNYGPCDGGGGIDRFIIHPNTAHNSNPVPRKRPAAHGCFDVEGATHPRQVRFTTDAALQSDGSLPDALEQHWAARVEAAVVGRDKVQVTTSNVTAPTFYAPWPLSSIRAPPRS